MSTSVAAPEEWDLDDGAHALDELRSARRRNRVAQVDLFDAFYKAYVTAIVAGIVVYGAAGTFGDQPIRGSAADEIHRLGPLWLGLVVAAAVAIGFRSGGRGGPLAFERADVRHVLLSPVDRRDSMRGPALRQLRHAVFLGVAVGAAAGVIALRRLPGLPVVWIACGAAFGAAVVLLAYGTAVIAGGTNTRRPVADTLAVVALAWAALGVWLEQSISPFSWLAEVAVWPFGFTPLGVAGLLIALVVAVAGFWLVEGSSIEAAERRSRLVGQLRFAATLQDVRTVMVLQRQLAQEHLRARPRIRLPRLRKSMKKDGTPRLRVFVRRSLHGLLRWPAFRVLRLFLFAGIAGAALCGAWMGTSPLVLVTALALWLMALDLTEALAQETDRPDTLQLVPHPPGYSHFRHLLVPGLVLAFLVVLGGLPAILFGNPEVVQAMLLPMLVACTILPLGGAALAVTRKPVASSGSISTPEVAGVVMLWNLLMPPGIAVLAMVPFLIARDAWNETGNVVDMVNEMTLPWYGVMAAGSWALAWLRHGGEMRDKLELSGAQFTRGPETEKK